MLAGKHTYTSIFFIFFLPLPASTLWDFSHLSSNLEFSISAITFFILVNCVIIVGYISISYLLHYEHVNVQSWAYTICSDYIAFPTFYFPWGDNCPLCICLVFLYTCHDMPSKPLWRYECSLFPSHLLSFIFLGTYFTTIVWPPQPGL